MRTKIGEDERMAVLRAAMQGERDAQQAILDYFDDYINAISTITIYSEGGSAMTNRDEDIKIQLQSKLLKSLNNFDLDGILKKLRNERNAQEEFLDRR